MYEPLMFQAMPPPSLDALTSRLSALPPAHVNTSDRPALYYTVTFRFPEGNRWNWSFLYVPSRAVVRVTSSVGTVTGTRTVYWRRSPTSVIAAFDVLGQRLRPLPVARRWR